MDLLRAARNAAVSSLGFLASIAVPAALLVPLAARAEPAPASAAGLTTLVSEDSATQPPGPARSMIDDVAFGHNLTATSYTVNRGRTSAGSYLVAYGITDELTIATSPWLAIQYNMPMLGAKYGVRLGDGFFERFSLEASYLKTLDYGLDWFHQESMLSRATLTLAPGPGYRIHAGLGFQYFWNDQAPFSLRPPPSDYNPVTISVSALQEIELARRSGIFVETGVMGANYPNPYGHMGLSFYHRWPGVFLQLGASYTVPLVETPSGSFFGWRRPWHNMYGESRTNLYYGRDSLVHPELQLQFLL